MVVGGTGDFFGVADHVLVMDSYTAVDATERAKEIARGGKDSVTAAAAQFTKPTKHRVATNLASNGKVKVLTRNVISYGDTEIDLGAQEQIISEAQNRAIVGALTHLSAKGSATTLPSTLGNLETTLDNQGLDVLAPGQFNGSLMRPRMFEVAAAINRHRKAHIEQK